MNSRMMGCLLFMATVLVARPVFATTYFVDDRNGDDQASGVAERQAWRSVERVNAADLRPGDIVRFRCGGEWRERLNQYPTLRADLRHCHSIHRAASSALSVRDGWRRVFLDRQVPFPVDVFLPSIDL